MPGRVPYDIVKQRAAELREVAKGLRQNFLRGLVGKQVEVIVTSRSSNGDGNVNAFSDNAVSISLPAGVVEYSEMGKAIVTDVNGMRVSGSWV